VAVGKEIAAFDSKKMGEKLQVTGKSCIFAVA
jgi:hypothetical protein